MRRIIIAALIACLPVGALAAPKNNDGRVGGPVGHALDTIGVKPIAPTPGQAQGSDQGGGVSGASTPQQQEQLWQKIAALTGPDLTYAAALADNAATPGSKLRSQCYKAILLANQQAAGAGLKDASGQPLAEPAAPHVFTDLERGAEIIDNLQPTANLMSQCAPAAQIVQMNTLAFVNALVTGLGAKALIP